MVRIVLIAVAVLVMAWEFMSLRANERHADGHVVLERARQGEITAQELRDGRSQLEGARLLNADVGPQIDEAALLTTTGRRGKATAVLDEVLTKESENFEAWVAAYLIARASGDRRRAVQAYRRVSALNPLLGDSLPPLPNRGS